MPSPNSLRFLREEDEKDYENRGVANLIKLYLDDATACDYHLADQSKPVSMYDTVKDDTEDAHLGSAAFGCNCIAYCGKTIATVRGQTNGSEENSLYDTSDSNSIEPNSWVRIYNEYEKYDRLIFQRVCGPYSGIPCEECYGKTKKLITHIRDQKIRCGKDNNHNMDVKTPLECAEDYRGDKMEFLTKGITCKVCGAKIRSAYKLVLYCRQCNFNARSLEDLDVICGMCAIMCGKVEMFEKFGINKPKDFEAIAAKYMDHFSFLKSYSIDYSQQQQQQQAPPSYDTN